MPQFQEQKKGQTRIRVLSKDAVRAYVLLMQTTGGKMQALPGDVYVLDEKVLEVLTAKQISFERIETR